MVGGDTVLFVSSLDKTTKVQGQKRGQKRKKGQKG